MKRCTLLLLALLLLPACGRAQPTPTTAAPSTTVAENTTGEPATEEEPTIRAFVPLNGEKDGVKWRTLDLDEEQNAAAGTWLEAWLQGEGSRDRWEAWNHYWDEDRTPMEFPMGQDKTIVQKLVDENEWTHQISLRDNKTGKETLLAETDREHGESPCFSRVLDERFFLYFWSGPVMDYFEIYDTKEMRGVSINMERTLQPCLLTDDTLYAQPQLSCDHAYSGPLVLAAYDLRALRRGEGLKGVNLLADIPHTPVSDLWGGELSRDGRYYLVTDVLHSTSPSLYIFDLEKKTLPVYLPDTGSRANMFAFRDAHTLYWFATAWDEDTGVAVGDTAIEFIFP